MTLYAEAFPTRQFRGFVSAVAAVADSSTRAFQVEVMIPNERAMLRPGMIVSLDAATTPKSQPVTVAPLNSIIRDSDASSNFAVLVLDGKVVHLRPVSLGETYGNLIAVSGVSAGEKLVTSGSTFVHDGEAVEVIP